MLRNNSKLEQWKSVLQKTDTTVLLTWKHMIGAQSYLKTHDWRTVLLENTWLAHSLTWKHMIGASNDESRRKKTHTWPLLARIVLNNYNESSRNAAHRLWRRSFLELIRHRMEQNCKPCTKPCQRHQVNKRCSRSRGTFPGFRNSQDVRTLEATLKRCTLRGARLVMTKV